MAEIKKQGDKLTLAHFRPRRANHLCGMLLQHTAGAALTGVVFRGSAPAITDMMAGRSTSSATRHQHRTFLRDGRIKATPRPCRSACRPRPPDHGGGRPALAA
jgi:tripartite-type tricarboxylate transporter receptor subunit TctC